MIDFGRTAGDYDRYRPGFPDSLYERLRDLGWIEKDRRALDLGTGTGALALGLAREGLEVTAIDRSRDLLEVAETRARAAGYEVSFQEALAESTGLPDQSFELICAGQCWWWFETDKVVAEVNRLLVSGGRLLIANFSYLPTTGSIANRTEEVLLAFNPGWAAAGLNGLYPSQADQLTAGGFEDVETFSYDVSVRFSREAWRGRMRACNGAAASLSEEEVLAFDRAVEEMLESEFPGPLDILHRVYVATGTAR